jgi:hypothetical protein
VTYMDDLLSQASFDQQTREIFHVGLDPVTEAREAIERWHLTPQEYLGQGATAVCILCTDKFDQPVVLKAGADHALLISEYAGLELWEPCGVFPKPMHSVTTGVPLPETGAQPAAFVMSVVQGCPPHSSWIFTKEDVQWLTERACDLWSRWQIVVPAVRTGPWARVASAEEVFTRKARWCTNRAATSVLPSTHLGNLEFARTAAIFLSKNVATPYLCHGDYSSRNLLLDGPINNRPLVTVCDPAAYVGDPLADLGHWLITSNKDDTGLLGQLAFDTIIRTLDVDPIQLYQWAVIAAVFEASLAASPNSTASAWLENFGPGLEHVACFLTGIAR